MFDKHYGVRYPKYELTNNNNFKMFLFLIFDCLLQGHLQECYTRNIFQHYMQQDN